MEGSKFDSPEYFKSSGPLRAPPLSKTILAMFGQTVPLRNRNCSFAAVEGETKPPQFSETKTWWKYRLGHPCRLAPKQQVTR